MANLTYVTQEGFQKMQEDLDRLTSIERPKISRQIAEARDKGDLSENAEYDAAKEAQGLLELRIANLQDQLAKTRIIDETKIDISKVQILSKVRIKNRKTKAELTYIIVAESEADLRNGKISVSSPIAKALLGKKIGEVAIANIPAGMLELEVLEISRV